MTKLKKSQLIGEVFKYGLFAFVSMIVLISGYKTIDVVKQKNCNTEIAKFEIDLKNIGTSVRFGQKEQQSHSVPCDVEQIYFFDLNKNIKPEDFRNIPILEDAIKTKSNNVFLVKDGDVKSSFYAGNLETIYPYYICFVPKFDKISFFLEGAGNYSKIASACDQPECTLIPINISEQEALQIINDAIRFGQTYPNECSKCPTDFDKELDNLKLTRERVELFRKFSVCGGITTVEIIVKPKPGSKLKNLRLYELIPKNCVEDLNKVLAEQIKDDVGEVFVKSDPLIMWHFNEVSKEEKVSYKLNTEIKEECMQAILGLVVAEVTETCQNVDFNCGTYPACIDCNTLDTYGTAYCLGNDVYKNFDDYSCSANTCIASTTPQLVPPSCSSSEKCVNGACVVKCGDGIIDAGEQCDGSNLNSKSCTTLGIGFAFDGGNLKCSNTCSFDTSECYRCGDGVITAPSEECDDYNKRSGDGCDSSCKLEFKRFVCTKKIKDDCVIPPAWGPPRKECPGFSRAVEIGDCGFWTNPGKNYACYQDIVTPCKDNPQCPLGFTQFGTAISCNSCEVNNNQNCGKNPPCDDCTATNKLCKNDVCVSCGNGVREVPLGEDCDDGNLINGDGCNNECKWETMTLTCYNVVGSGGCTDDAGKAQGICSTFGADVKAVRTGSCCEFRVCIIVCKCLDWGGSYECRKNVMVSCQKNPTCPSGSTLVSKTSCTLPCPSGQCGLEPDCVTCTAGQICDTAINQCVNAPTVCSDTTPINTCSVNKPKYCNSALQLVDDCNTCGCSNPVNEKCLPSGNCITKCGDGIIDIGEDCDNFNLAGETCTSLSFGPGTLSCKPSCQFDTSGCTTPPVCGNNIKEISEQCDGTDLASQTCVTKGFDGGTLGCYNSGPGKCNFDTSNCCTNACATQGQHQCTSSGTQTCDDYNGDGCLEWSSVTNCPLGCDIATGLCNNDPCLGVTCNVPTPATCLGSTSRTYSLPGTCSGGNCNYPYTDTTCSFGCNAATGLCNADPCAGVTCNTPPSTACINPTTSRTYNPTGTCSFGTCSYTYIDTSCTFGCNAATGLCNPDPCAGITCTSPPPKTCIGSSTTRTYGSGTCSGGVCNYPFVDSPCSFGYSCIGGNCVSNCGNKALDIGEECDIDVFGAPLLGGKTCTSIGLGPGNLKCYASTCKFDTSDCFKQYKCKDATSVTRVCKTSAEVFANTGCEDVCQNKGYSSGQFKSDWIKCLSVGGQACDCYNTKTTSCMKTPSCGGDELVQVLGCTPVASLSASYSITGTQHMGGPNIRTNYNVIISESNGVNVHINSGQKCFLDIGCTAIQPFNFDIPAGGTITRSGWDITGIRSNEVSIMYWGTDEYSNSVSVGVTIPLA